MSRAAIAPAAAPDDPPRSKALFVILAAAAVAWSATLSRHGFSFDEMRTLLAVRLGFADMVVERFVRGHPPLFFTIQWVWVRIVGEGEIVLRLPAVLAGLASGWLVYRLGLRLADARTALWAAVLLLASPLLWNLAHLARPYTLVLALCLGCLLMTLRVVSEDSALARIGLVACTWGALATHHSAWLFCGGTAVWAAVWGPRRRLLAPLGLAVLLAASFPIATATLNSPTGTIRWIGDPHWGSLVDTLLDGFRGEKAVDFAVADAVLFVATIVVAVRGLRTLGPRAGLIAAAWLGSAVIAYTMMLFGYPGIMRKERYFVPMLGVQTLLLAVGLLYALPPRRRWLAALAPMLLVFELAGSAGEWRESSEPPYREMAQDVRQHRTADEPLAIALRQRRWPVWVWYDPEPVYELRDLQAGPLPARPVGSEPPPPMAAPPLEPAASVLVFIEEERWFDEAAQAGLERLRATRPFETELPVPHGMALRLSGQSPAGR